MVVQDRVKNLLIVLISLQFHATFQQESPSYSFSSFSASSSEFTGFMFRKPCSFRGTILMHKTEVRLDSCTKCVCLDGTTTCSVESCPSDPGCKESERVVSPEECCPKCPGIQNNIKNDTVCSFRGNVFLQGQTWQLDPCTVCMCHKGTTTCDVSSCYFGCPFQETYHPPGECCARCQSTTTVTSVTWKLTQMEHSFYGKETPVSLDVQIEFGESEILEGVGMWRVGLFGSSDPHGYGSRFTEVYQTLDEEKAASIKKGTHLDINRIRSDFQIGSIGCGDAQYVCVEFAKGDAPDPPFIMHFDDEGYDDDDDDTDGSSPNSLIKCKKQICSKRNWLQKSSMHRTV